MTERAVIALAERIALEGTGEASGDDVKFILASMVVCAARGISSGHLRLAPGKPADLKLDDDEPI